MPAISKMFLVCVKRYGSRGTPQCCLNDDERDE